jgi:hypothetical protein
LGHRNRTRHTEIGIEIETSDILRLCIGCLWHFEKENKKMRADFEEVCNLIDSGGQEAIGEIEAISERYPV